MRSSSAQRGVPGHVLFTLPQVPLPSWAAAVSIGGPVTLESILDAFVLGLAARRDPALLRRGELAGQSLPAVALASRGALRDRRGRDGGAVVRTRSWCSPSGSCDRRGVSGAFPTTGLRGMRGVAVPVLESALDRSLQLATSMDARGYGRRSVRCEQSSRRLASGATVGGLLLMAVGIYGVIDGGSLLGLGLPDPRRGRRAVWPRARRRRASHGALALPPRPLAAAGVDGGGLGARRRS